MISAKSLSEAIRMKRKTLKKDGVENMIDTAPGPQMNPQDIYNNKQQAQMEDTIDAPEKYSAPDDPADETLDETQTMSGLEKRMAKVKASFHKLSR
jgi:hypothetical protein